MFAGAVFRVPAAATRTAALLLASFCAGLAGLPASAQRAEGVIVTVAGTGEPRLFGEGQPAVQAGLVMPSGLALDLDGNLYITDYAANRVLRVDAATGIITTVAGSGPTELLGGDFWGDGGPAREAALSAPNGIAVDSAGNIYIADSQNHRIRRIDPAGIITTVAGTGSPGYSGDDGPASEAMLWKPEGVALDHAGNLYIADEANDRIRRVDAATGIITTVAGRGRSSPTADIADGGPAVEAALFGPTSVAVDRDGTLYIADSGHNRIRRVDAKTGVITTVAGTGVDGFSGDGGPAAEAQLDYPFDVALTQAGDLLISDFGNHRIRRVDAATGVITTVVGSGPTGLLNGGFAGEGVPATEARLNAPRGILLSPTGDLYIADSSNARVRKVAGFAPAAVPGDVNGDGVVTVADAVMVLRAAVGLTQVTDQLIRSGDVAPKRADGSYGDGKITTADALRILRRAVGIEEL